MRHTLYSICKGVLFLLALSLVSCSSSSNDDGGNTGNKQETSEIKPDAGNDLYGLILDDELQPVKDVTVSDGFSCVQTDRRGFYQMKRNNKASYVFYSTPADAEVKANQFYKRLSATEQRYDFTLTKATADNHFLLIGLGDPQVTNNTQL